MKYRIVISKGCFRAYAKRARKQPALVAYLPLVQLGEWLESQGICELETETE